MQSVACTFVRHLKRNRTKNMQSKSNIDSSDICIYHILFKTLPFSPSISYVISSCNTEKVGLTLELFFALQCITKVKMANALQHINVSFPFYASYAQNALLVDSLMENAIQISKCITISIYE